MTVQTTSTDLGQAPFDQITADDPRFPSLGNSIPLGLRSLSIAALHALGSDAPDGVHEALAREADGLREWVMRADTRPLESEIDEYFDALVAARHKKGGRPGAAKPLTSDWTQALRVRLSIDGAPPITLEEAAKPVGVTRERVRQVEAQVRNARPHAMPYLPVLDRVVDDLTMAVALSSRSVGRHLVRIGVASKSTWTVEGLNALLELAERTQTIAEVDGHVGAYAHEVLLARREIRRRCGAVGVISLTELVESTGLADRSAAARVARGATAGARPLRRGWYTLDTIPEGRNRLDNTARLMLSVASPLSLDVVVDGLKRVLRGRQIDADLPADVVEAYLSGHGAYIVDEYGVRLARPKDGDELQGEEIQRIIDVLRDTPYQVMDRGSLVDTCVELGMSIGTVQTYLSFHEVLRSYGRNVWGLVGASVPESVVKDLQRDARAAAGQLDHDEGFDDHGHPWREVTVTRNLSQTGVILVPWLAVTHGRRFQAVGPWNHHGELAVGGSNGFMWGLNKVVPRGLVPVGTRLRIVADLAESTAKVLVAGS